MCSKNAYNTREADKLFNLVSMWVRQRKPKSQMLIEMAKDPSSRSRRRRRGSSGYGRNSRASYRVETGTSGNFLSCSKGVKNPLEVPDVRTD